MTKNNIRIKIFLLLWLVGSLIALLMHFFFPIVISSLSTWNNSIGWQREIALWNLSIIMAINYALIKDNIKTNKSLVIFLTIISFLLGTNHLITLLTNRALILLNLLGFIANYFILLLGIYISKRDKIW